MITNPTAFNSVLWTALVETEDTYLVGYYSLLDGNKDANFFEIKKDHSFPGNMKNESFVKRVIKLSQGWYLVVRDGDKTYINDMRFGQMGMGDDPNSFVFSHECWYEDGILKLKQRKPHFDNVGASLAATFRRIGGN